MHTRQPDPNDVYARFTNNWARTVVQPSEEFTRPVEPVLMSRYDLQKTGGYITGKQIFELNQKKGLSLEKIADKYHLSLRGVQIRFAMYRKKLKSKALCK